jgi:hypothetical protein
MNRSQNGTRLESVSRAPVTGRTSSLVSAAGSVGLVPLRALSLSLSLLLGIVVPTALRAEPVLDRALAGLEVVSRANCAIVKINFNFRIRYTKHFPLELGQELRVSVQPVDRAQAASLALLKREGLQAPAIKPIGIRAIDFEIAAPGDLVLRVQFDAPAAYRVAPGPDFESLIIAIAGKSANLGCVPVFPADIPAAWNTRTFDAQRGERQVAAGSSIRAKTPSGGVATEPQKRQAAASLDEARAAVKKGNYPEAIRLLNSVVVLPATEFTADALELLGVAYQKSNNLADARASYETYLARTPAGDGADRVRQRLAGISPSGDASGEKGRPEKDQALNAKDSSRVPGGTSWSVSGSASEFYYRDDSYRVVQDRSLPVDRTADKDAHQVHRNVLLSSFDLIAAWNNANLKNKFRFSGTEEHSLSRNSVSTQDIVAIASLNLETTIRDLDLTTRFGRQTRNTGGVIGRFDGGVASWQATPTVRLNTMAGSPVERRKDAPFKNDKYFYGASVDFGEPGKGFETSLFAITQKDRSILDRQAIGAELRYIQPDKFVFATVDYDVHYSALNAAVLNGSWTLADKSTINGALDYRKAPYLSAWTALQSQPFLTLYDMLKVKTKEEIDQLAIDRTATYQSATLGFSKPLSEKLQFSLDGTASRVSGTIASGGVDATLSPGADYYASAQLTGTNIFAEGDMYIGGLRYANRPESNLYVIDLATRYPVTQNLQFSPRLRFGYEVGTNTDLKEYTALPSVLFNYLWSKDLNFELETGTRWAQRNQAGVRSTTTDLFFTIGLRYDFNVDGRSGCTKPTITCR